VTNDEKNTDHIRFAVDIPDSSAVAHIWKVILSAFKTTENWYSNAQVLQTTKMRSSRI
jgi:hypothetical protein